MATTPERASSIRKCLRSCRPEFTVSNGLKPGCGRQSVFCLPRHLAPAYHRGGSQQHDPSIGSHPWIRKAGAFGQRGRISLANGLQRPLGSGQSWRPASGDPTSSIAWRQRATPSRSDASRSRVATGNEMTLELPFNVWKAASKTIAAAMLSSQSATQDTCNPPPRDA